MHFTKTIISFFAITGFAAAQLEGHEPVLVARQAVEAAREDYLEARDVYLGARDDYLLEKRKAPALTKTGNCIKAPRGGGMVCAIRGDSVCGYCSANAKIGSTCPCH